MRCGRADAKRGRRERRSRADFSDDAAGFYLKRKSQLFFRPIFVGTEKTVGIIIEDVDIFPLGAFVRRIIVVGLDGLAARDNDRAFARLRKGISRVTIDFYFLAQFT